MKLKNVCRILLILLILGHAVNAKENRTEIKVDFRVNSTRIDSAFAANSTRISEIISFLSALRSDSAVTLRSVSFCGAASPEGSYAWNRRLARGRLAALEAMVRAQVNIPDSIISRDDSYIPWPYLREQVARSSMVCKDTVLSIIDEPPQIVTDPDNGKPVDRRIVRLKRLHNRRVWRELFRSYFSGMRNAGAVIVTYTADSPRPSIPLPSLSPVPLTLHTEVLPAAHPAAAAAAAAAPPRKPFYMDVRTNMLYDVLGVPNLGVDFYLGKNISVGASYMHAWWSHDARHRYWRIYGGELNARWWFGKAARRKPLTGHHAGLYLQALTYDFEWGGKAYMGGEPGGSIFDRAHIGFGAEYGYSLPVSTRLNIDFSIGNPPRKGARDASGVRLFQPQRPLIFRNFIILTNNELPIQSTFCRHRADWTAHPWRSKRYLSNHRRLHRRP